MYRNDNRTVVTLDADVEDALPKKAVEDKDYTGTGVV